MIAVLIEVLLPIAVVAAAGFALRRALPLDLVTLNRLMIYGLVSGANLCRAGTSRLKWA